MIMAKMTAFLISQHYEHLGLQHPKAEDKRQVSLTQKSQFGDKHPIFMSILPYIL